MKKIIKFFRGLLSFIFLIPGILLTSLGLLILGISQYINNTSSLFTIIKLMKQLNGKKN